MQPEVDDLQALFDADCRFHVTILEATQNQVMRQLRQIILTMLRVSYEFGVSPRKMNRSAAKACRGRRGDRPPGRPRRRCHGGHAEPEPAHRREVLARVSAGCIRRRALIPWAGSASAAPAAHAPAVRPSPPSEARPCSTAPAGRPPATSAPPAGSARTTSAPSPIAPASSRWATPRRRPHRKTRHRHPQHLVRPQHLPDRLQAARRGGQARRLAGRRVPARNPHVMALRNLHEAIDDDVSQPPRTRDRGGPPSRAIPLDGAVLMGGCDKTTPAPHHGRNVGRHPQHLFPRRPHAQRPLRAERPSAPAPTFGATGPNAPPASSKTAAWREIEDCIARSPGHCMTMGTASTMTSIAEALGLVLPGGCEHPRFLIPPTRPSAQPGDGKRIVEMVWEDLKPFLENPHQGGLRSQRHHLRHGHRRLHQRHHPPRRHGRPCCDQTPPRPLRRALPQDPRHRQHPPPSLALTSWKISTTPAACSR